MISVTLLRAAVVGALRALTCIVDPAVLNVVLFELFLYSLRFALDHTLESGMSLVLTFAAAVHKPAKALGAAFMTAWSAPHEPGSRNEPSSDE